MASRKILIVTEKFDFHADRLILRLRELGHTPIRLSTKEFPDQSSMNIEIEGEQFTAEIATSKLRFNLDDITSIYWRRPELVAPHGSLSPKFAKFAIGEFSHALGALWSTRSCYWMSHPSRIRAAGNKPEQLRRAARLGFNIPRTLITTEPEKVWAFYEKCNGRVIYKPMNYSILSDNNPDPTSLGDTVTDIVYTSPISKEHLEEHAAQIRNAPCMFQEFLAKKYELRVTIIGEQIFVAQIDSQSQVRTSVDWRHYDVPMKFQKGYLPSDLIDKCFAFVDQYGLNYSAFDFVVTPDDRYVFLENNPNGQFMFVEDLIPEFRMTDALVDCLLNGVAVDTSMGAHN